MKREFKKKLLSLDFDGTCVKNEFPKVGGDVKAVPVLKKLVDSGVKIIVSNKTLININGLVVLNVIVKCI